MNDLKVPDIKSTDTSDIKIKSPVTKARPPVPYKPVSLTKEIDEWVCKICNTKNNLSYCKNCS